VTDAYYCTYQIHCRSIIDEVEHPGIGATEMILSNGMRICYKYTDFLDDQVCSMHQFYITLQSCSSRHSYLYSLEYLFTDMDIWNSFSPTSTTNVNCMPHCNYFGL
jgi:hypothetical protein